MGPLGRQTLSLGLEGKVLSRHEQIPRKAMPSLNWSWQKSRFGFWCDVPFDTGMAAWWEFSCSSSSSEEACFRDRSGRQVCDRELCFRWKCDYASHLILGVSLWWALVCPVVSIISLQSYSTMHKQTQQIKLGWRRFFGLTIPATISLRF